MGTYPGLPLSRASPDRTGHWVLVVSVLTSSMAFIDGTALNVALPALQASLGANGPDLLLVLSAYTLVLTALLLLGGALGDRYGCRRVLLAGIGLFTGASLVCGLAPDVRVLSAGRAVQGVGAALMIPGSLALLTAFFSAGQRGRAIGIWSACSVLVSAAGPFLGGILAQVGLWRGVFFLNLPLAVVALSLLLFLIPERRDPMGHARLDLAGALTATLGLAGISYGLIEATQRDQVPSQVSLSLTGGLLALLLFLVIEWRSAHPLLPLSLFRSRTFRGTVLLTLCLYTGFNGMFLFLPLNLIQVQGYSASVAGLGQLPVMLLLILISPWAGSLVDRYGPRRLLTVGPFVAGMGFACFALPGVTRGPVDYWAHYLPALAVLGLGMGLTIAPLSTTVMASVSADRSGLAAGINSTTARLANLLSVAVLGAVGILAFRSALEARSGEQGLSLEVRTALRNEAVNLGQTRISDEVSAADRTLTEKAVKLAFVDTFRLISCLAAGLAWAGAFLAALHIRPPQDRLRRDG